MAERPTVTRDSQPLSQVIAIRPNLTDGALALAIPTAFDAAYQAADRYAKAARAANTVRAYGADWRDFLSWCQAAGLQAMPAEPMTVRLYIGHLAELGRKASTIDRRLATISQAHKQLDHSSPCSSKVVRDVLAGIKRTNGIMQDVVAPALTEDLRAMVAPLGEDLRGSRDRALLLIGFAGAFRREELASIELRDVERHPLGISVLLRRSKTDQEGQGRKVGLAFGQHPETCPVRALNAWLRASRITSGPVFRKVDRWGHVGAMQLNPYSVALVVKRQAAAAGLDATRFAGHSLRAGLVTSAAIAGANTQWIMNQTGHKSTRMVRRYVRDVELFRNNVSAMVGL